MSDHPDPALVATPVTAPEWLVVALTEHLAATEEGGDDRRRHLGAARAAYQHVLDLCDAHCLPAAVRGLEALARHEADQLHVGVGLDVVGGPAAPGPVRTPAPGREKLSTEAPATRN
ncbi:MAG: hypothetical protein ABR541_00800 [Candidatus Dormibacteria bacterium]